MSRHSLLLLPVAGVSGGVTLPEGGGGGGGGTDFLGYPTHARYNISGGSAVLIENVSIVGGSRDAPSGIGITIANVTGSIIIRNVDLAHLVGGIYLYNCSGSLEITGVRSLNIGDGTIGSGHSNHIQVSESVLDGRIHDCQLLGGRTEDMISIFHSGGAGVGHELIVEDNTLQGLVADAANARRWISSTGTGIIVGDGPGSANNGHVIVRTNTLLTPGAVGIQHIDGPALSTHDNIIVGEQRTGNNNSMTTWQGAPAGEAYANTYDWVNADGARPTPWDGGGTGTMTFHDNPSDPALDPADYAIVF